MPRNLMEFGELHFEEKDFADARPVALEGVEISATIPEKWERLLRCNAKARELWDTNRYGDASRQAYALMGLAGWLGLTKEEAVAVHVAHYDRLGRKEDGIRKAPYTLRAWEKGRRQAEQYEADAGNGRPVEADPGSPRILPAEHLTDLGNAERFVRMHRGHVRFCYPWSRWFVWMGTHWAVDDTGEIYRRAKETVRAIYHEADQCEDENRRPALANHAAKCESEGKLNAMLAMAQSEPGIPVLPDALDRDPWLLNVQNGTLDLKTGQLGPHRREDLITKCLPVAYDPQAQCPRWCAFLDRIFDAKQALIAYVQRAIGYSLTGDVSEQCMFLPHGPGENGKSTQLQTLLGLLDAYAKKTPTETLMVRRGESIPNDLARLRGARLVVAVEAEAGRRLAESLVKELTGGDTIAARFMRAEWFEFEPQFKLWLATNHKPRILGTDRAIWRRIRLIPFAVIIPKVEQDRQLGEKLREEWPGILAWAVEGCREWQAQGLGEPEEVIQATEAYRAEQDVLGAFIEECCYQEAEAVALAKDLFGAYRTWTEANGERLTTQKDFGVRLGERGFTSGAGAGNVRKWFGIGLLEK